MKSLLACAIVLAIRDSFGEIEVYCSIIGIRCQQKTTRLGSFCLAASRNETDLAPVPPTRFSISSR